MLGAAACAPDDEPSVEPIDDPVEQQPQASAPPAPDTTAASLWAHLQSEDYRTWPLYPGKGELYTGTEPHGMLLTTYVHRIALDALSSGATFNAGGLDHREGKLHARQHVRRRYRDAQGARVQPRNGDWYWAKFDVEGVAEEGEGHPAMCRQCHAAARDHDYVVTAQQGN